MSKVLSGIEMIGVKCWRVFYYFLKLHIFYKAILVSFLTINILQFVVVCPDTVTKGLTEASFISIADR